MFFQQIPSNGDKNFAYLIADEQTLDAVVVDPSFAAEQILDNIVKAKFQLKYLINTHSHYDHIFGNNFILTHTNAILVNSPVVKNCLRVKDGELLKVGNLVLKIIATPGHTPDSICILVDNKLLTGDTLFVGDVGITASREDAWSEFNSIKKLLALPDTTEIYPGHDYGSIPSSTIGYEKQHNICIQNILQDDFAAFLVNK